MHEDLKDLNARYAYEALDAFQKLNWFKKWIVRLGGRISLGLEQHPGWGGPLEHFLFICANCGLPAKSRRYGYESYFICPSCGEGN